MPLKNIIVFIVIIALIGLFSAFGIIGDYIWFVSIGMQGVFLKILYTKLFLGLLGGGFFLAFSAANIRVSQRKSKNKIASRPLYIVAAVMALVIGLSMSANWEPFLKFSNPTPFNIQDPVFSQDIGFYIFAMPFLSVIYSYFISTVILSLILTFISYFMGGMDFRRRDSEEEERPAFSINMKDSIVHTSILFGILFIIMSFGFSLAQWGLLLSSNGTVLGAGYTDINIILPLYGLLSFISIITGLIFFANIKIKRWRLPFEAIGAFAGILIIGLIASAIVQGLAVAPDEFNVEKPFIERSIYFTLGAYKLDDVEEGIFPVSYNLSKEDIAENEETIKNIRLWDYRPLLQTYNQLQLFRTYYNFNDIDIDRYEIDGMPRQVMVSAREIDQDSLPSEARTWVNRHLVYTHGYGIVMNPVNRVTTEGLPEFLIKDIPPKSSFQQIERNEIYFGEGDIDYAIVGTTTQELDYPIGDDNVYTTFSGEGGISLEGFNRIIYAIYFKSPEILFSNSIGSESRLLMKRNIVDRVAEIAPFLTYDGDPYIVLSEGKLYWMMDAYTTSNSYPYSSPFSTGFLSNINYVRNSVKIVVDAYSGDMDFYIVDSEDPVIETYRKIFPSIFKGFEEMPASLKEHIRYPEGLFRIQAEIYSTYHMKDPMVFYNKEDVWVRPEEIYRGNRQELIPYYVIMKIPGEDSEEFALILPFVPRGKDNLIGWMAARSDQPNYGKLIVFRFSKQELIYGPLQIEARIDQDTDISSLFTLWSQAGSSVIRGNTLVIPVENSILYIEPVFLEAMEKGTLPQLKRVIVAYGDRLTMQSTLDDAIDTIFGDAVSGGEVSLPPETPGEVLKEVSSLYKSAQDSLREGDLKAYAEYMDQIGELLKDY